MKTNAAGPIRGPLFRRNGASCSKEWDGQEPAVCYGVSPPCADRMAPCLFEQSPLMPCCSLAAAEKSEM